MKQTRLVLCCITLLLALWPARTFAQETTSGINGTAAPASVPRWVRFGGSAKDVSGKPLTGVAGVTFALYKEQEGGAALWMETQNVQLDSNGRYSITLGSSKAEGLPSELFANGEARWLGVQVAGQAEQPRVVLLSVPYALKAADAETIGGLPPSAFMRATPQQSGGGSPAQDGSRLAPAKSPIVHGSGTLNFLPLWTGASLIGSSVLIQSGSNVGIGTDAPATTLDVNGAATIRGNTSVTGNLSTTGLVTGSGYQIGSNLFAFGSASKENAFLGFAGNSTITGPFNTGSGYGALRSGTTGDYNTASGYYSLEGNTTGSNNTANGANALALNNGSNNTATGSGALLNNSTATGNTASGFLALFSTTSGGYNVADGASALYSNTTGTDNTASGSLALYSNNTGAFNAAIGYSALYSNTTGNENTAIGHVALYSNTTGINNTAVGVAALTNNTTGGYNTGLGWGAGPAINASNLYNTTAVGYAAVVTASNSMVLGYNGINNQNVGIGTSAPQAALDVAGNNLETYIGDPNCGSGTAAIAFGSAGFQPCSNYALRGDSGGNLYINSSSTGWMFFDHNNTGLMSLDPSGNLSVSGAITAGTKDFKIDHPLDPTNKYLYHASVESSEMMNIYTGNVTTDAAGDATVDLPDWFEALNGDFRYQLTVIGQFAQAIVGSEIANRQFTIKTDKPNVKVSWQVTGVRHDAWATAHRLQVEVEKPALERGHYLHPEAYPAAQ